MEPLLPMAMGYVFDLIGTCQDGPSHLFITGDQELVLMPRECGANVHCPTFLSS